MKQPVNSILQLGYVVADLHAAIDRWVRQMGAGPFFLLEHFTPHEPAYRGKPGAPDVSMAFGYSGAVQIELIQQHDDTPSVYKEFIDTHGAGYHHFWKRLDDFDAAHAGFQTQYGVPVYTGFTAPDPYGARYAYFDARRDFGGFLEIIDMTPVMVDVWEKMEHAAATWDRKQIILPFPGM